MGEQLIIVTDCDGSIRTWKGDSFLVDGDGLLRVQLAEKDVALYGSGKWLSVHHRDALAFDGPPPKGT
jgi:hypothetical protein